MIALWLVAAVVALPFQSKLQTLASDESDAFQDSKAESVKVVRATLESKTLSDCVIHHVQEIQFPQLPKPYETSYTYGFEAM